MSNNELTRLADLSRLAVEGVDTRDLLQRYAEEALHFTGATRAFVALAEFEAGGLVPIATAGPGWTEDARRNRLADRDGTATITARVATTARPVCLADVTDTSDPNFHPEYKPFFPGVHAVLAVPIALKTEARVRGVINVECDRPGAFHDQHEAFLSSLADLAALRLSMEDWQAREAALVQIGRELALAPNPEELGRRVVRIAEEMLRFEDFSVWFLDPENHRLVLTATRGEELASQVRKASYSPGEGLTGWVAQTGASIRVRDPRNDPRWRGRYLEMHAEEMGAFLAVPIRARKGIVGVLRAIRRKTNSPWFPVDFTEADEQVLVTVASLLGAAVDNADLLSRVIQSERMAAWGEMSAMTSHQIGNRAFAVKGSLNELEYLIGKNEPEDAPLAHVKRGEALALLREMWQGMFQLDDLLGEFRDFVRAGTLTKQAVDATESVKATLAEMFPKQGKTVLQTSFTETPLPMQADPAKLKRAFGELIENSVTMQEGSGTLTVSTTLLLPEERLPLGVRRPPKNGRNCSAGWACITFADSGPGVKAEDKERIFRPFVTTRTRGMGLGLAIVKGIVDAHHGMIVENGEPGKGARFVVLLPLSESASGCGPDGGKEGKDGTGG